MIGTYWAQPEWQRITFPHTVKECRTEYNNQEHKRAENEKYRYYYEKLKIYLMSGPKTRLDCVRHIGMSNGRFKNFEAFLARHCYDIWSDNVDMVEGNEVVFGLISYDIDKFRAELERRELEFRRRERLRSRKQYRMKKLTQSGKM